MDVLDVLRGIAVLGILLVNVESFIGYGFLTSDRPLPGAAGDARAIFLIEFLVQGKFYCLFSFLFGAGFSVFIQRASWRGSHAVPVFRRRLVGLLLIGLIHSLLIWYGDILTTYAVIGFGLIPFLRKNDRAVLRAAVLWLASPVALYLLLMGIAALAAPPPPPAEGAETLPPILASAVQGFAHGGYVDVLRGNLLFTAANVIRRLVLMFYPRVFGMFLIGFYAARTGIFARLVEHVPLLRRIVRTGLLLGLPLAFVGAWLGGSSSPRPPSWIGMVEMVVESIATPLLAIAYASGICLYFLKHRNAALALAPVGRMALTNYLAHSVLGVAIFYGIGAGWYGRVSFTFALIGCVVVFAIQVALSRMWLSVAFFGPAEWLWRMFTYRRHFRLLRR